MPQLHTHTRHIVHHLFLQETRAISLSRESAYVPERSMKATRDPAQISSLLPQSCSSTLVVAHRWRSSPSSRRRPFALPSSSQRLDTHTSWSIRAANAQSGERPTLSLVVVSPVLSAALPVGSPVVILFSQAIGWGTLQALGVSSAPGNRSGEASSRLARSCTPQSPRPRSCFLSSNSLRLHSWTQVGILLT